MNAIKNHYRLYIDECGDQNLENYNPSFPVFVLCGILVSRENDRVLEREFNKLKTDFWGTSEVIIHSRDIRRCKNEFINLLDPDIKKHFYERVNAILATQGAYVVVACGILKEPFVNLFSKGEDVYGLSLSYLIERSIFCVEDHSQNGVIDIVFEKRGKLEDRTLTKFYNGLRDKGTEWIEPARLKAKVSSFTSKSKKENIIGLQIADLIAYPIARKILNPDAPNPAFDVIKHNIFVSHGAMLGLTVIPH